MSSNLIFSCETCDTAPSLSNTIVLPLLFFSFSALLPCINRDALNVRRALKRYDDQPVSPVPEPEPEPNTLTADETRAERKARFRKRLSRVVFGVLSYLSVLIFGIYPMDVLTWEAIAQKSPSIILGIFLSYRRPFTILSEVEHIDYVRRVKSEEDGARTGSAQVVVLTVEKLKLPPLARRVMRIVWPAVLGFLTLDTGMLVPFFWLVHHHIRMASNSPQGTSLKSLVKGYFGVIASFGLSTAFVVGLKILLKGKPSQRQRVVFDDPAILTLAFGIIFSIVIFVMLLPIHMIVAIARNYDVQRLEQDDDLEAKLVLSEELTEVESDTKQTNVPVLKVDENGRRPEIVQGTFQIEKNLFSIYWSSGPDKPEDSVEKVPTLRLPTCSSAIIVLQSAAILVLGTAILATYEPFDRYRPNMAWLYPIGLDGLFRPDVLKRMEAVSILLVPSIIWTFSMFIVLTLTVLISVFVQHGTEGVQNVWSEGDQIWSGVVASSTNIPMLEEVPEAEKVVPDAAQPLLIEVAEK